MKVAIKKKREYSVSLKIKERYSTQYSDMGTTKIAIVSDIHANIIALKIFLDYLKKSFNASDILNLGDFIQIGPHPREVTEIILNDKRFINILGNNEVSILNRDPTTFDENEFSHQDWTIKQLGPDTVRKLGQLSKSNILTINEKKILMIHSRPYSTTAMPLLYHGKSLEEFVSDYDGYAADLILFGHTHIQAMIKLREDKTFINPGSLGCSKDSMVSFCLAEIDSDTISFSFKKIHYDSSKIKDDLVRLNVPARERILRIFFGIEL
jgi:putative phosphoesterase